MVVLLPRFGLKGLGLVLVGLCSLALLAQRSAKVEDPGEGHFYPVPGYPEELLVPPEPPNFSYPFIYIGYAQTSQGVLQDDPLDHDLLLPRQGWSAWETAFKPPENYFGFRVPTFEALIDMVVDRQTSLLGATPYDRQANPNGEHALEHIEKITF